MKHHCKFATISEVLDVVQTFYTHTTRCEIWNTVYGSAWLIVDNLVQEIVNMHTHNEINKN